MIRAYVDKRDLENRILSDLNEAEMVLSNLEPDSWKEYSETIRNLAEAYRAFRQTNVEDVKPTRPLEGERYGNTQNYPRYGRIANGNRF